MRKLAPARVSYRDDFLISHRVYMMTGSFHISLFEGTLHVDKIHVWFKIANITHALSVPVYRQTDFTPKRWSFPVYRIPPRDFVLEWNSRPGTRAGVNSRRGDSRWHDILWWYHVNKYRAMRGNRSELAPGRKSPRCHVNTPLEMVNTQRATMEFYTMMWILVHARWLVVAHDLSVYRYMVDVTENLCCSTWRAVLKIFVRLFRIKASESLNKLSMSYLQRGKMEKQRQKEPFTTWECLNYKKSAQHLPSCAIATRLAVLQKCFRHYSALSKERR